MTLVQLTAIGDHLMLIFKMKPFNIKCRLDVVFAMRV